MMRRCYCKRDYLRGDLFNRNSRENNDSSRTVLNCVVLQKNCVLPESKRRRNVLTILGYVFSEDVSNDYRIFGLIDPPNNLKEGKYVCWSIVDWGLIRPPKCTGIDTHLVLDSDGYWYISSYTPLTVNGEQVKSPDPYDLPNYGRVCLVFGDKIEAYLLLGVEIKKKSNRKLTNSFKRMLLPSASLIRKGSCSRGVQLALLPPQGRRTRRCKNSFKKRRIPLSNKL